MEDTLQIIRERHLLELQLLQAQSSVTIEESERLSKQAQNRVQRLTAQLRLALIETKSASEGLKNQVSLATQIRDALLSRQRLEIEAMKLGEVKHEA